MNLFFYLLSISLCFFSVGVIISLNPVYSVLFLVGCFFVIATFLLLAGADFLALCYIIVYVGAVAVLFLFVVMMLNIRTIEWFKVNVRFFPLSFFFLILFVLKFVISYFETFFLTIFPFFFNINALFSYELFSYFFSYVFFLVFSFFLFLSFDFFLFLVGKTFSEIVIDLKVFSVQRFIFIFNIVFFSSFLVWNCTFISLAEMDFSYFFQLSISSNYVGFFNISFLGNVIYTFFFVYFIIAGIILLVAMYGSIYLTILKTFRSLKQNIFSQIVRGSSVFLQKY